MPNITVQPSGKVYEYEPGGTLLEILLDQNIFVDNPCNGKGICGKCRIRVLKGDLETPGETEQRLLKEDELAAGVRLSCLVKPDSDLEVELMQKERKHEVLTSGYVPKFDFDVDIQKKVIEIRKPTLEDQTPYEDQVKAQVGFELSFDALRTVRFVPGTATAVIHRNEVIQIEAGDTTNVLYGVAIDVGTTTVVCTLVDMLTGKELAHASMINAQIVLSKNGRLLCCSCAAGPALEGMNISSGMRAAEGAIEDAEITADGIRLKVIGNEEPIGICGSGILAVVKELLKAGLVRKEGVFIKLKQLPEDDWRRNMIQQNGIKREFILTDSPQKLLITQGDIRQV